MILHPSEVAVDRLLVDDADFLFVSCEFCAVISGKNRIFRGHRLTQKSGELSLKSVNIVLELVFVGLGLRKAVVL